MDMHFCLEAMEEAIARYGKPEIVNTDQGSQFTAQAFTGLLEEHDTQIGMDGKGMPSVAESALIAAVDKFDKSVSLTPNCSLSRAL